MVLREERSHLAQGGPRGDGPAAHASRHKAACNGFCLHPKGWSAGPFYLPKSPSAAIAPEAFLALTDEPAPLTRASKEAPGGKSANKPQSKSGASLQPGEYADKGTGIGRLCRQDVIS
jgi:hypothetical protein